MLLKRILSHHVLANLTFCLILIIGTIAYFQMPRAKDPEINFNWINITTFFPGATAEDVEKRITNPLEKALRGKIQNMKYVSSTSREGISNILIRFEQISEDQFYKRIVDLRREIQNTYSDELPSIVDTPIIQELTSSNAFPSASVVITSAGNDENLRQQSQDILKGLERINGVDTVTALGLADPELHIIFNPEQLHGLGITSRDLSDTVANYFQDISAGDIQTNDGQWLIRIKGINTKLDNLAKYPITTAHGIVKLGQVAEFTRTTKEAAEIVKFQGQPAVFMGITKQANSNVLELIDRVQAYLDERNSLSDTTGVRLVLVDDQTISTRNALSLMQTNALIGLLMVLFVTWIFLGNTIAFFISIGIPFTLAGTFLLLKTFGFSLNNTVLLGIVISLGMLVDDAVVVVESIYYHLRRGLGPMQASLNSLRDVFAPVTTSVLTTIAAFLPLMLMPGILGEFMRVIPLVVSLALAISLIEAYWILPTQIIVSKINLSKPSRTQQYRVNLNRWISRNYIKLLLKAFRYPLVLIGTVLCLFALAITIITNGQIRSNFFEGEELRLFYVNVEMPPGTSLEETDAMLAKVQTLALAKIDSHELRASVTYAGQMFTDTAPLFGDTVGQIMINLNPASKDSRSLKTITDLISDAVTDMPGTNNISLLLLSDGPPAARDIQAKVRGNDTAEILVATKKLAQFLQQNPLFQNVSIDYQPGNPELVLDYDGEAIQRAGIAPELISHSIQTFADGTIVTDFQDTGEKVNVRIKAKQNALSDVDDFLRQTISLPDGRSIAIGTLVHAKQSLGESNIRHYNFKQTITLEADIDSEKINVVEGNEILKQKWQALQKDHPTIDLDFTGILDDIQESLDALIILFILGIGLMYIILGTQFSSYFQPFMILASIPLAFTGVVFGLWISDKPLSLYTVYGTVALAGISVNAAIVLISVANKNLRNNIPLIHATIYAAKRRVIPILITSLTTISSLFSLAAGLAGSSAIWGTVAIAIVWGLTFSTVLTLFVIPILYKSVMQTSTGKAKTA